MTTKNMLLLIVVAAVLGAVAWTLRSDSKPKAAALNGRTVLPGLDLTKVAEIDMGGKLTLKAADGGWQLASHQGFPADRGRIVENLMKLTELKVGQVARGRALGAETLVTLKGSDGAKLASLRLGDRHARFGRYAAYEGETVLVGDTLDAFDGDPKSWCDTKVCDRVYWTQLPDPTTADEVTGLATGAVCKVTFQEGTNKVEKTAKIGVTIAGGSDRYFRIDGDKWLYGIASYTADNLLPKPEKKEEPKAEEPAQPIAESKIIETHKTEEQK